MYLLQVGNSSAIKGHFLDFIQDIEYKVFTFSLFDNNIDSDISWSIKMQSEDRAEDMKIFRREGNREMNTVVHGNGPGLGEGSVLPHQKKCV